MLIEKEFVFDSAHFLPFVPANHKCRRLHGHTYKVIVALEGEVNAGGWIMDFADISAAVQPVLNSIDHTLLNAVPGLENPTAENIALWIFEHLRPLLPGLNYISVQEGMSSRVIYPRR
jgi:6-pyruvoyltetrahydropterin/6-carboxytetrahydropterin synthase